MVIEVKYEVHLSEEEEETLTHVTKKGKSKARKITRAWVLLKNHEGKKYKELEDELKVSHHLIYNVRKRYCTGGLESALNEKPRPGQPKKITAEVEAKITALACETPPKGRNHWTIELIREELEDKFCISVSWSSVQTVLKAHCLKPWKKKTWCVPRLTERFIERMIDLLDLYGLPYDENEPVVCVDEKSKQLLDHVRAPLPLKAGFGIRVDHHYRRKGTRNLFVGIEPKGKKRVVKVTERRTKKDYARYIFELMTEHYPDAEKVHVVADNLNTHPLKCLKEELGEDCPIFKRLVLHFTPVHASWLNQAELEIGVLERQCLNGRRFPDEETLREEVQAWARERNAQEIGINWTFTKKQAEVKFKIKNTQN